MLIAITPPRGHHGCMDCGHQWEPGEQALNDRRGGPWALACADREACEARQESAAAQRLVDAFDFPDLGLPPVPCGGCAACEPAAGHEQALCDGSGEVPHDDAG